MAVSRAILMLSRASRNNARVRRASTSSTVSAISSLTAQITWARKISSSLLSHPPHTGFSSVRASKSSRSEP